MNRVFLFPIIFAILPLIGFGQDPTKVAPDAYKIEFENEWVKAEFLRFALKTKPVKGDGKEAQHAHPHD
jgi:hypothetical protein